MVAHSSLAAAAPFPALTVEGLSKTFPGQRALAEVDLTVDLGEVHALLGENGSGKSTLIKVLSGYHKPDSDGQVSIGGVPLPFGHPARIHKLGARFVHQDLGLIDSISIADNLFLGSRFPTSAGTVSKRRHHALTDEALAQVDLKLDPAALVGTLSPAERTGVAIARAIRPESNAPAQLLVLDEPTAALPEGEVEHLLEMVKTVAGQGIAVIYVTHRIDEVFRIADRVTVLREGSRIITRPMAEISRDQLVTALVGRPLAEPTRELASSAGSASTPVLSVNKVAGHRLVDLCFESRSHEVLGIAGITGSGREAALATVFGAATRAAGSVKVDGAEVPKGSPRRAIAAGMAYMPADRKTMGGILGLSAKENLTLPSLSTLRGRLGIRRAAERAEASRWFDRLSVRPREIDRRLAVFSGGNQQKVLLAKWLRCQPRLLLVDEPTQGVDLAAKGEIHNQLRQAAIGGASVIVSSSDVSELGQLCDRVLILRDGRVAADVQGTDVSAERISRLTHHGGEEK